LSVLLKSTNDDEMSLYSAPEKVAGESVGVAADIWGVGVLAFIL